MDCVVHGVAKSWAQLNNFHFHSACKFNKQGDKYTALSYSFLSFELVCCSMSDSNYRSLTHTQVSQETDNVVWYSHLFKNFPQFVVIHTVKGISIVNEADVFLELPCFLHEPMNVDNLISGSPASSKPCLYIWKFLIHVLLKSSLKDFEHNLARMRNKHNCTVV